MNKRGIILIIAICLILAVSVVSAVEIEQGLEQELDEKGELDVIVVLKEKQAKRFNLAEKKEIKSFLKTKKQILKTKKEQVEITQENVLSNLDIAEDGFSAAEKHDFKLKNRFSTINAFSGKITRQGLEKLKKDRNVAFIQTPKEYSITLDASIPIINADDAWNLIYNGTNITGAGETVCIIDTGIDYTHENLGNCSQSEFLAGNCSKIPGGYDTYNDDNNPMDDHGHGTHCAGIVASENETYMGVAPDAKLIAVKSLSSTGNGDSDTIADGIDWCVNNSGTYNISVISMSIGTSGYHSAAYCDSYDPTITAAINSAKAAGMIVMVASGNEYVTSGISSPGCTENATPIGATTDADAIADYTNTAPILDLIAPGSNIYSTKLGGNFETRSGTSMATPHAAAAAALLLQYKKLESNTTLTPDEIEDAFNATGLIIYDNDSAKNYSRIDIFAAIQSLDNITPTLTLTSGLICQNNTNISISIDSNEILTTAILKWNGTNETMNGSGLNWNLTKPCIDNLTFMIYGNDSFGNLGQTENYTILINTAPNITLFYPNTTNVNIAEPDSQIFNITAEDAENDTLSYYWYQNSTLMGNQSEWNFTGGYLAAGAYNITAVVSDGFVNDTNYWNLTVNNTNAPPEFNSSIADKSWKKNTNSTINLASYFYDVDNDNLTYNSTSPSNITVYVNNTSGIVLLEPDANFTGNNTIIFYAYDPYNESAESNNITLTIIDNTSPSAENLTLTSSDSLNRTNGTLTADYDYYDGDGDNETDNAIRWYVDDVHSPSLDNLTQIYYLYTSKGENWTFSVRVNDGEEWSEWYNSSALAIENSAPVLDSISDIEVDEGDDVEITADAEDADDDDLTYYIYEQDDSDFDQDDDVFTWETSSGDEGTYYVDINVTDGEEWDEQEDIKITVSEADDDGNGGGGGGGGGGGTTPPSETKDSRVFSELAAGENTIAIDKQLLPFSEYEFTTNQKLTQITVTTEAKTTKPSYAPVPSGNVYKYITISSGLTPQVLVGNVEIEFKIEKTWFTNYDMHTVKLLRYQGNAWNTLTTSYQRETSDYYYYISESPGFSLFAITADAAQQQPVRDYTTMYPQLQQQEPEPEPETISASEQQIQQNQTPNQTTANQTTVTKAENAPNKAMWIIIGILVATAVFIVGFSNKIKARYASRKKTKARKPKKEEDSRSLSKLKKIEKKQKKTRVIHVKKKKKQKTKVKVIRVKEICPKCGSRKITRGYGGELFCSKCGTVIKTD